MRQGMFYIVSCSKWNNTIYGTFCLASFLVAYHNTNGLAFDLQVWLNIWQVLLFYTLQSQRKGKIIYLNIFVKYYGV